MSEKRIVQKAPVAEQMSFNTEVHSPQYLMYANLLSYNNIAEQGRKPQLAVLSINPADFNTMYMLTKFMSDKELNSINENRRFGCGCGKCGLFPIPRLAHAGNGNYVAVKDQRERMKVENESVQRKSLPQEKVTVPIKNIGGRYGTEKAFEIKREACKEAYEERRGQDF